MGAPSRAKSDESGLGMRQARRVGVSGAPQPRSAKGAPLRGRASLASIPQSALHIAALHSLGYQHRTEGVRTAHRDRTSLVYHTLRRRTWYAIDV